MMVVLSHTLAVYPLTSGENAIGPPRDVREHLEERARYNGATLSAEAVWSVREGMERERGAAVKIVDILTSNDA
jgi:hypothetical protein